MSKRLIIDAGHGGNDPGANGFGVLEKDWNLAISLYQYERLKQLGSDVSLTRSADVTLEPMQRVARIKNQYELCVSNHWNAFNGSARGVETIHSIRSKPAFAAELANRIAKATDVPVRRVFTREMRKGVDFYFMHRLTGKTETVIIEYGFIDNKSDHDVYKREAVFYRAAEAVIEAICHKIGIAYTKPVQLEKAAVPAVKSKPAAEERFVNRRVESIHDGKLRFYIKPSWADQDVFGHVLRGQGFPTVVEKIKVGRGEQYQVKNSKGRVFYITASQAFVRLV